MNTATRDSFAVAPKGIEELRTRAHRLDLKSRNLLFLIDRGFATIEALLQKSILPREDLVARLRNLVADQFVDHAGIGSAAAWPAPEQAPAPRTQFDEPLSLAEGVSLTQARFSLANFCLDCFGIDGQAIVTAIERTGDVAALQHLLNRIADDVRGRHAGQLQALFDCVDDINATGV